MSNASTASPLRRLCAAAFLLAASLLPDAARAANLAPVANPDSATTAEDTAVAINVLANDSDPNGDVIRVAINTPIVTPPQYGVAVRSSDSVITYTPAANFFGTDSFRYRIADGSLLASAVVTVTVTPVNDPPIAVADSAATAENAAVDIVVTANDRDPEGATPTLISSPVVVAPTRGTATRISASTIRYTPNANQWGSDTFQYEIGDGSGARARAWVNISVTDVNNPPIARDDSASASEDTAITINVLANDSDPDGDVIRVAINTPIVAPPAHGTATRLSDTSIVYTPAPNFFGTDSFRYRVADGSLLASATVTVTVAEINDAPVANNDSASTREDLQVDVNVAANDTDPDGDTLSLLTAPIVTAPVNGTATRLSATTIRYQPRANWSGSDSFQYEIGDNRGKRARAFVTLAVTGENDPPVAREDSATTSENVAVTINVIANDTDPEGDVIRVANPPNFVNPQHGTVVRVSDSSVRYTPHPGYSGSDSFRYQISDGVLLSASALVTVAVTGVNDPPVAVDDNPSANSGIAATFDVLANDSDPEGDSFYLTSQAITIAAAHGSATRISDREIRYQSNPGFEGFDGFEYEIRDALGRRDRGWVRVLVVDRTPEATAIAPEVVVSSSVAQLTVTGENLQGASVEIAAEPNGDGDAPWASPAAKVLSVAPDGRSMTVEVDASKHADGFYNLSIATPGGRAGIPFRVIEGGIPKVDVFTPSEAVAGNVHVLSVMGVNLAGATVEPMGSGIRVLDLDNGDDHHLIGLLYVESGAPVGHHEILIETPKGATVLPLSLLAEVGEASRPFSEVKLPGRPSGGAYPLIYLQEPTIHGSAEGLLKSIEGSEPAGARAEGETGGGLGFCFTVEKRRRYSYSAILLSLSDELGNPLTRQALDALRMGDRIRFSSTTLGVVAYIELNFSFQVCENWVTHVRVCISGGIAFMVPLVGGQSFTFNACTGTNGPTITLGAEGFISNHQWSSSSPCLAIRDSAPDSRSGLRSGEIENFCCDSSQLRLRIAGQVFGRNFDAEGPIFDVEPQSCEGQCLPGDSAGEAFTMATEGANRGLPEAAGLCVRILYPPGLLNFINCSDAELESRALISENGHNCSVTPENDFQYALDGWWKEGHSPCNEWFKIPSHCTLTKDCATGMLYGCCNSCGTAFFGLPRWTTDDRQCANPFCSAN